MAGITGSKYDGRNLIGDVTTGAVMGAMNYVGAKSAAQANYEMEYGKLNAEIRNRTKALLRGAKIEETNLGQTVDDFLNSPISIPPFGPPSDGKMLNIPHVQQFSNDACAAACMEAQFLFDGKGTKDMQEKLYNNYSLSDGVVGTNYKEAFKMIMGNGYKDVNMIYPIEKHSGATWASIELDIINSIKNDRPVHLNVRYIKGGGHHILITGFAQYGSDNYLYVMDPGWNSTNAFAQRFLKLSQFYNKPTRFKILDLYAPY